MSADVSHSIELELAQTPHRAGEIVRVTFWDRLDKVDSAEVVLVNGTPDGGFRLLGGEGPTAGARIGAQFRLSFGRPTGARIELRGKVLSVVAELGQRSVLRLRAMAERSSRGVRSAPTSPPTPLTLAGGSVLAISGSLCSRSILRSVTAMGWHPASGAVYTAQATPAALPGGDVQAVAHLSAADWTGLDIPAAAAPATSHAEVERWARGALAGLPEELVLATLLVDGDPELRAGSRIELAGVGEPFAGIHRVLASRHTIEGGEYQTRLETLHE